VKAVLLVADVLHGVPHGRLDRVRAHGRPADLASDDDAVRGGERLATHANVARSETGLRALAKKQIDDFV